jgi:hypothetical protein
LPEEKKMEKKTEETVMQIETEERRVKPLLSDRGVLKERINQLLRILSLKKFQTAEELLMCYEETIEGHKGVIEDTTHSLCKEKRRSLERERINLFLFKLYKESHPDTFSFEREGNKGKIEGLFLTLRQKMMDGREDLYRLFLSDLSAIIRQGTLENDIRFLDLIERQLKEIERYESPRFFKLSVQLEIAKKYVKDMITLKKKAQLSDYYRM